MAITAFFRSIDRVASSQLILDKTCLNDYGFAPDICDDLQHHDANNTVVQVFQKVDPFMSILSPQNAVAQFGVYESIVDHLFPIVASFFFGSWSDTFGRKWLLYLYFLVR